MSFRARLILAFLLVIGATGGIATIVGALLIGQRFVQQAQAKVAQDINSARVIYEHEVEKVGDAVRLTANRYSVRDALRARDFPLLAAVLRDVRTTEGLDLLALADPSANVLVRGTDGDGPEPGEALGGLVRRVAASGRALTGTQIVAASDLAHESAELRARARIAVLPTPRARAGGAPLLDAALVVVGAAPVVEAGGAMLGVLYGGRLLNRSTSLVDRITGTVFRGEAYRGREIGTATLFLGDVRIATSVRTDSGDRAIGTRIQAEVGDRVLREGKPWIERAFVVNGWYLTAYEPIRDFAGAVVGILYVGVREDKFVALRRETTLLFLAVTLGGTVLAGGFAFFLSRDVLRRVRRLAEASREISAGNFDHRVPEVSRDEFGGLERAFNRMSSAVSERDRKLRENAEERIIRSANLASLGQIAASVAHEVNNPLAGILVYLRLMLRYLSQNPFPLGRVDEMREWVRTMEAEGLRCGRLIQGMLHLGRQQPMRIAEHDLNAIVEKSILLLEHRFTLGNTSVVRRLAPSLPPVECDGEQIQQTLMGMLLNSFEAMPRGGTITVESAADPQRDTLRVRICDTGVGIAPENLPRVFDAFFTTKGDGKGIGLGLSIALAILRRHNGKVDAESEPGRGSSFTVTLPRRHASEREETGVAAGDNR